MTSMLNITDIDADADTDIPLTDDQYIAQRHHINAAKCASECGGRAIGAFMVALFIGAWGGQHPGIPAAVGIATVVGWFIIVAAIAIDAAYRQDRAWQRLQKTFAKSRESK